MKMRMMLALFAACTLFKGCGQSPFEESHALMPPEQETVNPPAEVVVYPGPGRPVAILAVQHRTMELPIRDVHAKLTLGNIFGRKVIASLATQDGLSLHSPVTLYAGDTMGFTVDGHSYVLELTSIDNQLRGQDSAEFLLSRLDWAADRLAENEKIEILIRAVAALGEAGAIVIHDEHEHSASDAAESLRREWQAAGPRIQTAEQFIEQLASSTASDGNGYVVRLADGRERPADEFLREELEDLKSPSPE